MRAVRSVVSLAIVSVVVAVTAPVAAANWSQPSSEVSSPEAITVSGGRVWWIESSSGRATSFAIHGRAFDGRRARTRNLALATPGEIRTFGLDEGHEASGPTVLSVLGGRAWIDAAWCTDFYGEHSQGCVSTDGGDTVSLFNRRSGRRILTRRGVGASVIPGSPTALGQRLPDGTTRVTDPTGRMRPVVAPKDAKAVQVAGQYVMWIKGSSGDAFGTRRAAAGALAPNEAGGWTTLEVTDRRTGTRVYRRSADDLVGPSGRKRFLVLPPKLTPTGAVGLELVRRDDASSAPPRPRPVFATWADAQGRVRTIGPRRLGPTGVATIPNGERALVLATDDEERCTGAWITNLTGTKNRPTNLGDEYSGPTLAQLWFTSRTVVAVDDSVSVRVRARRPLQPGPWRPRCKRVAG